jgi:hypothetical protein
MFVDDNFELAAEASIRFGNISGCAGCCAHLFISEPSINLIGESIEGITG